MKSVSADRRFPLYWSATAISQLGDEITFLAMPWLIATETASPLATGAFEALGFLPYLLLGLPIGVLADRGSRRLLMIQSDLFRFVLVATIPVVAWLTDESYLVHLLAVAFIAGAAKVLFESSAQAFVADIVPHKGLVDANAKTSLTEGMAIVIAPAVAGLLIALIGAASTLAIDALTFLASAVFMWRIGRVEERRSESTARVWSDVAEGLRVIRGEPMTSAAMSIVGTANIASGALAALWIIFMQVEVGLSAWQAGAVLGANGIGVLIAGWTAPRLARHIGLGRTLITGISITTIGIMIFVLMRDELWFLTGGVGLALVGLGVLLNVISATTLRQKLLPGEFLGRVTATYRTIATGALATGAFAGGALATAIGMRPVLWMAVAWYAVVSLVALRTALNVPARAGLDHDADPI